MSSSLPPESPASVGPAPKAAATVFGDRLQRAVCFAELLAGTGITHGLIGPREVPRLWQRHILNCAVVAEAMPEQGVRVIDVGSGAGLPGVAVALARPDLEVHLIEPMQRRVDWLTMSLVELKLDNVVVHRGRAEDYARRLDATYVTARAVARLVTLLPWCAPLVTPGGSVVAMKGSSAESELAQARPMLRELGLVEPAGGAIRSLGVHFLADPATVVILTRRVVRRSR